MSALLGYAALADFVPVFWCPFGELGVALPPRPSARNGRCPTESTPTAQSRVVTAGARESSKVTFFTAVKEEEEGRPRCRLRQRAERGLAARGQTATHTRLGLGDQAGAASDQERGCTDEEHGTSSF